MRRLTGRTGAIVGLITAAVLLFVTIDLGLRVPGTTFLDPFRIGSSLDYRALGFGSFAPLRSEFIAKELGSVISAPATASAASRGSRGLLPGGREAEPRPVVVSHRFTNDNVADAYFVSSVPFTAKTNTAAATKQPNEPTDCAPVGGTAWYRYRSPRSQGLIANTFGSEYATALGVFSGSRPGDLQRIGCDTDARGFAQVAFAAQRGTTYWFQIAGPVGGGDLVFNLMLQGVTTLASRSSTGQAGDADAIVPSISADGRFVAFYSNSTTFTPDTPPSPPCVPTAYFDVCQPAVFLRDRLAHRTSRTDLLASGERPPSGGLPPNAASITGSMSEDARYVSFWSDHPNLTSNDTNETWDVFLRDQISGRSRLVSVSSSGEQGNAASYEAHVSADGRSVGFSSAADNLVPGDTNGVPDVFLHDVRTRRTIRVSVRSDEEQANRMVSQAYPLETGSHLISMSANGRYMVFRSVASNLVPGDTNEVADVFIRDLRAGTTKRVSVSSSGEQANADTRQPIGFPQWNVSNDGRFVFFNSDASNLVPRDTNGAEDIFVRDMVRGTTRRVSVSSSGAEADQGVGDRDPYSAYTNVAGIVFVVPANGTDLSYSATPDGRYVVFSSDSTNLVSGDTNETVDIFLHDMMTRTTTLLSISSTGELGDGPSNAPVLSADGRYVAFESAAENLIDGDDNGSDDVFVHEVPRGEPVSGWY